MTVNEFQSDCKRTLGTADVASLLVGMAEELGEVIQTIKHNEGQERLGEEIGDVIRYATLLLTVYDIPMEYALQATVDKQRRRPPDVARAYLRREVDNQLG